MTDLDGKHVLIMATDRFEESELFGPRALLLERGAKVTLASLAMERSWARCTMSPDGRSRPTY